MAQIFYIDFSTVNDEFNWIIENASTAIQTIDGRLKISPDDANSLFKRNIGSIDATMNRIRLKTNFQISAPAASDPLFKVNFAIFSGTTMIDEFSVYEDDIDSGDTIQHHLEREYYYSDLSGNVSLHISFNSGYENSILIEDIEVENYQFNETNVRSYFVVDGLLNDSKESVSSGLILHEWKIDGEETLTNEFFSENNSPGGNPINDWLFAKADVSGNNREAETDEPNSFNPFKSEWGLEFENVTGNYFGGKPTGTNSGSNYGQGIMSIGFLKPKILNGNLASKGGAFFIDIDYSKDLRVVFDVVINNSSSNLFDNPSVNRRYFIIWDSKTCTKRFYYQIYERTVSVLEDGFLFGVTPGIKEQNSVPCDETFSYSGNNGVVQVQIDFGTSTGEAGIDYDAMSVPDKFTIEWNGQTFSSGYVGSSSYDEELINNGVSPSEINTGFPSTGSGQLTFTKNAQYPTTALITISAPLGSTAWNLRGVCPKVKEFTEIKWADTTKLNDRTGALQEIIISIGNDLIPVTNKTWQISRGKSGEWVDSSEPVESRASFLLEPGTNKFRLKGLNESDEPIFSNELKYTRLNG